MLGLISDALEQRFHPSAGPEESWLKGLGLHGAESYTGKTVTPQTSLELSTVYACVRVISETVASLPLITYRRLDPRGKERATAHPLYPILHDFPNPEMTRVELWEALIGHLCLWGNAYANLERGGDGRVLAMWPLRPDKMVVRRTDGELRYTYELPSGEKRGLRPMEVMHLRGLSHDGIHGYSPIRLARESIGLGLAAEEFGARFYGQGGTVSGVLQHPANLTDAAAGHIRESFNDAHQGLTQAHRLLILEEGMKYERVGIPPNEAQFLETRKFQREEMATWYRMPPHMVGILDHATFTNIEHQSIDFVVHTIRPWTVRIEMALLANVVPPLERRTIYAEWLVDGLLRGDQQSRYQAYNTGRMGGFLSGNDIREIENMNPLPGNQGDVYWAPLNMTSAEDLANNETNGDQGAGARGQGSGRETRAAGHGGSRSRRKLAQRYTRLFQDTAQRIVTREVNDLRAGAQRHLQRRDAASFLSWAEEYEQDTLLDAIVRTFSGAWLTYADVINDDALEQLGQEPTDLPSALEQFVLGYLASYAQSHTSRSLGQLRQIVREALEAGEDALEGIDERLTEWSEKRAAKIADVETNRLGNAVAKLAFLGAGVQRLVWSAGPKACPICLAMNGKTVSITGTFLGIGDVVESDDDDTSDLTATREFGHPPLHGACDCGIDPG